MRRFVSSTLGISIVLLSILWLTVGVILYYLDNKTFLANWINSAVAIGAIGVIIMSIHQNGLTKKENLVIAGKNSLFVGMEIMDQISNLDQLYIKMHKSIVDDDKSLTANILKLQWDVKFIFGESNEQANDLLDFVRNAHERYQNKALNHLKDYLIAKSNWHNDEIASYKEYSLCYSRFKDRLQKAGLDIEYQNKLVMLFNNDEQTFKELKNLYFIKANEMIKSLH